MSFAENEIFARIRSQINSGLPDQKHIALLLEAVDQSIQEQGEEPSPTAYFAALMTLVDRKDTTEEILSSVAYLLNVVMPHVPPKLLQVKFEDISKVLTDTMEKHSSNAGLVRSLTGCLESLLLNQPLSQWRESTLVKRLLQIILILTVDPRPKPRKRAQDAIALLLQSPPPPTTHHPASLTVIQFITRILSEHLQVGSIKDKKQREANTFHILVLLKATIHSLIVGGAPEKVHAKFSEMIKLVLQLPVKSQGSGNSVMTQWVFQALDALFTPDKDFVALDLKMLDSTLKTLIELKPNQYDLVLLPTWLQLLANGFVHLAKSTQQQMSDDLEMEEDKPFSVMYGQESYPLLVSDFVSTTISTIMTPENKPVVVEAAAKCLCTVIREAILDGMILEATTTSKTAWHSIVGNINGALSTMRFREAWGGLLDAVAALFDRLAVYDSTGQTSLSLLKKTLLTLIGFRDDADYGSLFPFKKPLDDALDSAVRSLGIENFVKVAPLNLLTDGKEVPRGYLLHVFQRALSGVKSKTHGPNTISYLTQNILPLAQTMFEKSANFWSLKKGIEAKLYETLGVQLWSLVPAVADTNPRDVDSQFSNLATILGRILQRGADALYPGLPSKVDLVPFVCDTLCSIVENNNTSSAVVGLASKFLTTLCNNYTSIPGKADDEDKKSVNEEHERHRTYYEQAIRAFLKIADPKDVSKLFEDTVKALLQMQVSEQVVLPKVYAVMDLVHILLPHLPSSSSKKSPLKLYYQVLAGQMRDDDVMLQKKTYRAMSTIISLVAEGNDGVLDRKQKEILDVEALASMLSDAEVMGLCGPAAKKARVHCVSTLARNLPVSTEADVKLFLQFIPLVLSEIVLATKDGSERARSAAFDTIVAIGYKMAEISEDAVMEYLKMIAAGMIGTTPHMQSATITCLSRLLFEFRDVYTVETIQDMLEAVLPFVESRSNEIAKSALGFVKVAIVSVDPEHLSQYLELLVKSLLVQSRDKKSHFRVKVRHTLERLVRRFSYEAVEGFVPEEDKRFIVNIRKRRERAKKKKSESSQVKKSYDDTVYGSESDLGSDEEQDSDELPEQLQRQRKQNVEKTWIREDGDDPIDFMDARVVGKVLTSDKSVVNKKRRRDMEEDFEKGDDGRMIFKESDDEEEDQGPLDVDDYTQATQGEGAVRRMPGGKLKFARGNKRTLAEDFDNPADVLNQELEAAADARDRKPGQRSTQPAKKKRRGLDEADPEVAKMMGKQFKSKRAAGDMKRGDQDPFAYIPLSTKIMGNKRKTAKVSGQFKNILKAAKKGVDRARSKAQKRPQFKKK